MVSPGDIRPLFYTARFFGCAPHVVTDDDVLVTKRGTIYSAFCAGIYLCTCLSGMYLISTTSTLDTKLLILTAVRTLLSYACLFADTGLTMFWNRRIRTALSQLRSFDRATKFGEYQSARKIRNGSAVFVCFLLMYWLTVGYATYRCETTMQLYNGLTYGLINMTISLQVTKFIGLIILLRQRFQRLCEILLQPAAGKIMVVEHASRPFRLQEIWWLHCCLANATETINSVYSTQLLLWISSMSFNTLSRIYTINEGETIPLLLRVRESLLVSACVTYLLLITTICHSTSAYANRVGEVAFSPLSPVVGKRDFIQDNTEAAAYFQLKRVNFFAAGGLIRIDLPLLLSIASGITTYLVILHAANNV